MTLMSPPERYQVTPWNIDGAMRYWTVLQRVRDLYRPDLRVLEVGSGSAGVTEFLEHPVTGVDVAFERTAELRTELLTPVEARADSLPFEDASFDVVLSLEMLEHVPAGDRAEVVRELLRVLRPGGRMVLTFPSGPTAARLDAWLNEAYRRRHGSDHPWAVEHLEQGVPDAEEVRSLVESLLEPGDAVELHRHAWAPVWKLQQLLFSVEWGYPWTRALGIHTKPTAKLLFRMLRGLDRGDCYRAVVTASKRPEPAGERSVDVVVVTADTRELTLGCVGELDDPAIAAITVVDNASSDGTAEALAERYPHVSVVRLEEPAGYSAACNRGATGGVAPLVLFLNSDVLALPGAVGRLAAELRARPGAVAAGGRLVDPEDLTTQHRYGPKRFPGLRSFAALLVGLPRRGAERVEHEPRSTAAVDQPAGACVMVRRADLEALGGFDEGFWFWYEDVDLARRLATRGQVLHVPAAAFRHVGGASFGRWTKEESLASLHHGMLRYAALHFSPLRRLALAALVLVVSAPRVALFAATRPERAAVHAKAIRSGLALLRPRGSREP